MIYYECPNSHITEYKEEASDGHKFYTVIKNNSTTGGHAGMTCDCLGYIHHKQCRHISYVKSFKNVCYFNSTTPLSLRTEQHYAGSYCVGSRLCPDCSTPLVECFGHYSIDNQNI